jgi:hypothetical protein
VDSNKSRLESKQRGSTHIASSKFFSAMALLPSALSASAISRYDTGNSLGYVLFFVNLLEKVL